MNTKITLTPLNKVPEKYNEMISIIEEELGYSPDNQFSSDFYPLVEPSNWKNCYLICHENEIIGHIGLRPTTFFQNNIEIEIGLIGGICIKKQFQGKGIFKNIFPILLNEKKNDFALFILWTGESLGYQKFGFYELGRMIQTGEHDFENTLRFSVKKLNKLNEEEKDYIKSSYQHSFSQYLKPKRTEMDWEIFFSIPSVDVYFKNRNHKLLSYFMINKGQDLNQVIHEIGSHDTIEFSQLCHDLNKFKMWLPSNMGHESTNAIFLFLGVFKLANYNMLNEIATKLGQQLPPPELATEKEILEIFLNSNKINFYIPGINSI